MDCSIARIKGSMKHKWQYLNKPHQRAMEERICYCGAHIRGPTYDSNGTYTGSQNECPIDKTCDCQHEDCPSEKAIN